MYSAFPINQKAEDSMKRFTDIARPAALIGGLLSLIACVAIIMAKAQGYWIPPAYLQTLAALIAVCAGFVIFHPRVSPSRPPAVVSVPTTRQRSR